MDGLSIQVEALVTFLASTDFLGESFMTNFLGEAQSSTSVRARALKGVALSAVTLAMVAPGFAQAQQDVQEVTITGSRIKAPNLVADSPTQSVSQEEIKQANVQAVEQLLNNLPSVTADFTAQQSSLLGSTTASVNLRGLGSTRNLVLIDGRRIGPGDPSSVCGAAADLNFIPTPLVKSVEVLTGGAGAVYGSDAIAGVVNFHLIRDFQGAQLDFSYSAAQHSNNNSTAQNAYANTQALYPGAPTPTPPKNVFDGFIRESSGIVGSNSPDGKGNVTMYADYRSTTPVQSTQRDWEACPIYPTTNSSVTPNKAVHYCAGSSTNLFNKFALKNQAGLTYGGTSGTFINNPNGTATLVPFSNGALFNFSATSYLQRQDDRAALGSYGHYEVNEHADLYAEMMYMNDSSQQQDGAGGLFANGVAGVQTTLAIPCTNPYIGHTANGKYPSQYQALGCATPGVSTATIIYPGLRFTLPRQDVITHDDYRALAGVRGDIDGNWTYDVSASHWVSSYSLVNNNWALLPAVNQALQNGTLNIFQYGGDTLAQQQGVSGTEEEAGNTKEDDVQINLTGDLGPYGGKSPFASSPVAVAGGLEYRHDTLNLNPDANIQAGYVLGGSGKVLPISGGEMVTEEYGEIRAPIVQDKPFVQALDLNLAFRHSDFTVDNSSSAFSTNTYKINADYAPMDDFRFRGGYNRAARAPNVYELFQPNVYGNDGGYNDPCAGATPVLSAAVCTNPALGKAGISAAQYGGVLQCSANQCNNYTGGNTALKPEEADTWTWGVNITPTILPGFSASIDYWDIKVANYIGTLAGSTIVNGCYAGQTYYCQFITRDPLGGGLVGNGKVSETNVNLDSLHNTGIDVDLEYTRKISDLGFNIPQDFGALSFHLTGTYNIEANTQALDTIKTVRCAGLYGSTCGNPLPNWRHQARLTWITPWNADFSVNWRYIGGSKLDAADPSNPAYGNALVAGSPNAQGLDNTINGYNYIDLSASYKLWDKYTLRAGVNNLMDKDPPVLNADYAVPGNFIGENGNTFTMYDTMGRVLYMSFSAKF
jgi:outer membrane receptor protein involved in Fe transport